MQLTPGLMCSLTTLPRIPRSAVVIDPDIGVDEFHDAGLIVQRQLDLPIDDN